MQEVKSGYYYEECEALMFTKAQKTILFRSSLAVLIVCGLLFLLSCRVMAWGKGDMISPASTWEALDKAQRMGSEEDVKRLVTTECWSSHKQCIIARKSGESRQEFLDRLKITEDELDPPHAQWTFSWKSSTIDILLTGRATAWLEFRGYYGGNPAHVINELEFVKTSEGWKLNMWLPGMT